jgi:hypothetical protein
MVYKQKMALALVWQARAAIKQKASGRIALGIERLERLWQLLPSLAVIPDFRGLGRQTPQTGFSLSNCSNAL